MMRNIEILMPAFEELPLHHFALGGNKFVKVSDFGGVIRVHIRSYHYDGQFHPTKYGITMSPLTFYKFSRDVYRIENMRDCVLYNDELLDACTPSPLYATYSFQQLTHVENRIRKLSSVQVSLNRDQFDKFCSYFDEIILSCKTLLFGTVFMESALQKSQNNSIRLHDENLFQILINILTNKIKENIGDKILFCGQCVLPGHMQPDNQLGHDCMSSTLEEKQSLHFTEGLLLMNPKFLATSFADESKSILSKSFLENLNIHQLIKNTEEMNFTT